MDKYTYQLSLSSLHYYILSMILPMLYWCACLINAYFPSLTIRSMGSKTMSVLPVINPQLKHLCWMSEWTRLWNSLERHNCIFYGNILKLHGGEHKERRYQKQVCTWSWKAVWETRLSLFFFLIFYLFE